MENYERFSYLSSLCESIIEDSKNLDQLEELNKFVLKSQASYIKVVQPVILVTIYKIIKKITEKNLKMSYKKLQLLVDILKSVLDKSSIDDLDLFFSTYNYLLSQIYDHINHKLLPINEEYKLSIMECTKSLTKSVSFDILFDLYSQNNGRRLCQMLYVASQIAQNEKLRNLRVASIECIMAIARVLNPDDLNDKVLCNQVADVFLVFLPGITTALTKVVLDVKVGFKVLVTAIRAFARVIFLLMQNYEGKENELDLMKIKNDLELGIDLKNKKNQPKFEISRNPVWYNETDKKLQLMVIEFAKLTHDVNPHVRKELADMCEIIILNCMATIPRTVSHLIQISIILTADDDKEIASKCAIMLNNLYKQLSSGKLLLLLEFLEEGFYNCINTLPRKFNVVDDKEQLKSLNLLIGYIKLFGEHELSHVLLSANHLEKLLLSLIYISELEHKYLGLCETIPAEDIDLTRGLKVSWKNFHYFNSDSVRMKLQELCGLFAHKEVFRITSDFFLDTIINNSQNCNEGIFILNEILASCEEEHHELVHDILSTYLDCNLLQVPVEIGTDPFGCEYTLEVVQKNTIQVCLLIEGIGKIAYVLKSKFEKHLYRVLYVILEKAGNNNTLIKSSALFTLECIITSCGYPNLTSFINKNMDYFTFHIERKLNKLSNVDDLNILIVVLKYCTVDVLPYIGDIMKEIVIQSCDKLKVKNITAFLKVFIVFIERLRKWFKIQAHENLKSKKAKLEDIEEFRVTGLEKQESIISISPEDNENELKDSDNEVEGYRKPDPPLHIKLTVIILARTLHFVPSKNKNNKLLALGILTDGVEILRNWDDELLPIVHQIWSPLVQRFKEYNEPLIINRAFKLLTTLARLAKDFIRMRTVQEVLPVILEILEKFSRETCFKANESASRFTQSFKLEMEILENIGKVLIFLDVQDQEIRKVMKVVLKYLSEKQPVLLRDAALKFYDVLVFYDANLVKMFLETCQNERVNDEYKRGFSLLGSRLITQ